MKLSKLELSTIRESLLGTKEEMEKLYEAVNPEEVGQGWMGMFAEIIQSHQNLADRMLTQWSSMEMEDELVFTINKSTTDSDEQDLTIEQKAQAYERSYIDGLPDDRRLWETAFQICSWAQEDNQDGAEGDPIPEDILEWAINYDNTDSDNRDYGVINAIVSHLTDYNDNFVGAPHPEIVDQVYEAVIGRIGNVHEGDIVVYEDVLQAISKVCEEMFD